jgi:hypothetical protein
VSNALELVQLVDVVFVQFEVPHVEFVTTVVFVRVQLVELLVELDFDKFVSVSLTLRLN